MGAKINLQEKKFGRLTAVRESNNRLKGLITWECICECGNKKLATTHELRSGNLKSCGCLRKENASRIGDLNKGEVSSGFIKLYGTYKRTAYKKNISFNLDKETFNIFTTSPCFYCGTLPKQKSANTRLKNPSVYVYNGIDRVDPDKGYKLGNIVPCCKICNYAKHTMKYNEFINWVHKVYYNITSKEENSCAFIKIY